MAHPARVPALRAMGTKRFVEWSFGHYLKIAHPDYALGGPHGSAFANAGAGAPSVSVTA